MNDDKNKKKIIVITGVTRGLGRALAEKFISLGHTVLGCGTNKDLIHQLQSAYPKRHDFDVVDIAFDKEVEHWVSRLHKKCGAPDLVLNNAGVINRAAPLWRIGPTEFSEIINVNLKGTMNVIRHFAPNMIKKHKGLFINFSSGWGRSAEKEVGPYVATKWAVEGLTQSLAQELPSGTGAVALNPGIINTDMLQRCFGESAAHYPSPGRWAERAAPFILKLDVSDNGQSLDVPEN
jgi:NAD(P)-dependent dehydrogenase (short-subunit alcohol dehydrogenase family)